MNTKDINEIINNSVDSVKQLNPMELWNKVCVTNPNATKNISYGKRKFTAIDAQFQIKRATELFGSFGRYWGVRNEVYNIIEKWRCIYYTAILYYPNGQIEIHSDIQIAPPSKDKPQGKYNDDWTKKLATDALTKGLSRLGFNSDVFEGKFDNNKYVEEANRFFNGNQNNQNGGQ